MNSLKLSLACIAVFALSCTDNDFVGSTVDKDSTVENRNIEYVMPDENQTHEGTWLQWPHHYEYGTTYRNSIESTWIAMTKALVVNEKVHIIAYNQTEKSRIIKKLNAANIPLTNVDFKLFKTNDVWVRDNGPIYVESADGQKRILDFGFNGWGNKTRYAKCDVIPKSVATATGIPSINLNSEIILEGGAFEIDANGTFLATKSAILNTNRNPNMTQAEAEEILSIHLGIDKFIWLDGVAGLELTDMHIDGFARFGDANTIVTMNNADLAYWEVPQQDISTLYASTNVNGSAYNFLILPLTANNVKTTSGKNLGYKGSYVNYYVANNLVIVPSYSDPNDVVARNILKTLYPNRNVIGIDVRNLYENGGMIHCVTQQQPAL